jgi:acetyl esterase
MFLCQIGKRAQPATGARQEMDGVGDEPMVDDRIDPNIRNFIGQLNAGYAHHDVANARTVADRRRIAELVRADWCSGGPQMAGTRDFVQDGIRMRLHRPNDADDLPVMLYVHGGGWMLFSIDTHDRLMREYAARAGIAVLGIDYSLSPEAKFPTALHEVVAATRWLEREGKAWGLDTANILIGGDSAGANLSVAACLMRRDAGWPPLAGMVLNYGAFDPTPWPSYTLFDGPDYNLEVSEMDVFWQNYVADPAQLADPLVAPIRAALHDLPPAMLAIAACDILADSNRAFARRLADAGVAVTATVYEAVTHSFLEAMSIAPVAAEALDDQAQWINATLLARRP